jgi:inner membrane protein
MDTVTHLIMGVGLAGLAQVDPAVAADPAASAAVLIGTVAGSQAPDLDGLTRLRSNALYVRHHRGITHSLPAVVLWTVLIAGGLALAFPGVPAPVLTRWVFIAVALHVFMDLFNSYGTQALRPFTEKWIALNVLHIFDPVIFGAHAAAIVLWLFNLARADIVFPMMYALLAVYVAWRSATHARLTARLPQIDSRAEPKDRYELVPTVHPNQWNVIKTKPDGAYVLGEWKRGTLAWVDEAHCARHPAVEASKQHPDIAAFLYYSTHPCAELKHHPWGYEVRWIDVRYRHRKQYPFVGVVLLDRSLRPLNSYVGWLGNKRIGKKLRLDSYS